MYRHHKERIKFVSRLNKNASPTLHNNEYSPNHNQQNFINSQKVIDQIKDSIPPWIGENVCSNPHRFLQEPTSVPSIDPKTTNYPLVCTNNLKRFPSYFLRYLYRRRYNKRPCLDLTYEVTNKQA